MTPADAGRSEEVRSIPVFVEKKIHSQFDAGFRVSSLVRLPVAHDPMVHLRGERSIQSVDVYDLIKFLPSYVLPAGIAQDRIVMSAIDGLSVRNSSAASNDAAGEGGFSEGEKAAGTMSARR